VGREILSVACLHRLRRCWAGLLWHSYTRTCVVGAACNASTNQCQADKPLACRAVVRLLRCLSVGPRALLGRIRDRAWHQRHRGLECRLAAVVGLDDAVQVSVGYQGTCAVRARRRDLLGNPFGTATTYTPVAVAGSATQHRSR